VAVELGIERRGACCGVDDDHQRQTGTSSRAAPDRLPGAFGPASERLTYWGTSPLRDSDGTALAPILAAALERRLRLRCCRLIDFSVQRTRTDFSCRTVSVAGPKVFTGPPTQNVGGSIVLLSGVCRRRV